MIESSQEVEVPCAVDLRQAGKSTVKKSQKIVSSANSASTASLASLPGLYPSTFPTSAVTVPTDTLLQSSDLQLLLCLPLGTNYQGQPLCCFPPTFSPASCSPYFLAGNL